MSSAGHPVHPRACGERQHSSGPRTWSSSNGSSPRLRGTGMIHSGRDTKSNGSSPRLRGTALQMTSRACLEPRFIPAPAGNGSYCLPRFSVTTGDGSSPRLRGTAAGPLTPLACDHTGSSPRLRGTLGRLQFESTAVIVPVHPRACGERTPLDSCGSPIIMTNRFIPAPAGNGAVVLLAHDHPHGSSPRLRGTGR